MKLNRKIRWSKMTVMLAVSMALVVGLGAAVAFAVAPGSPTITTEVVTAGNAIKVSWAAVPNAATYEVQSKLASASDATYVTASTVATVTYTVTGLNNGVAYTFRVRGISVLLEQGPWSTPVNATPADTLAPTTALETFPLVADGTNGWFKTWPTYKLVANEPVSHSYQEVGDTTPTAPFAHELTNLVAVHGDGNYLLTEGTHTLWFYSIDSSNNTESVGASATVKIDVTKPVITSILADTAVSGANGWYKSVAPTITVTPATDLQSGVQSVVYAFNGVVQSTVTTDVAIKIPSAAIPSGTTTITAWAIDKAGNQSTVETLTVKFDGVAPSVPGTPTATAIDGGKIKVTWPVSTDAVSGVSTYTVQASADTTFTSPTSSDVTTNTFTTVGLPEGTKVYFRVKAFDVASNESTWSVTSAVVTADHTAPVLTVVPADTGWQKPSITATISVEETNSGLAFVNYKILIGSSYTTASVSTTLTSATTTQVVVPIPMGDYRLVVTATDLAGNVAASVTRTYKTDSAAPVTTIAATDPSTPDGASGSFASPPAVKLTATDAANAAVLTTYYHWGSAATATVDGAGWTVDAPSVNGTATLTYWTEDAAGNIETAKTQSYKIDLNQPVVTPVLTGPAANGNGWRSGVTTASVTATTGATGKAIAAIYYKYDAASTWTTYTVGATGFPVIEGAHTISFYAVDASGTAGLAVPISYKLDMTKPVINQFTPAVVYSATPTLTVSVTDGASGSGVFSGTMAFGFDGAKVAVVTTDAMSVKFVTPLVPGDNIVSITAIDAAGNVAVAPAYRVVTYVTAYTINASFGANGAVSPAGATSVAANGTQAYTITPNAGFHIASVLVDGVSNAGAIASGSYTFSNVTAAHTISATFAANPVSTFTVTATQGANGSISPAAVQTVNSGASVDYVIAAATGFHTTDVLVDGVSVGARSGYTFSNVTANHTIAAIFTANAASTFTISSSAGAHGAIIGATDVLAGGDLTVGIQADAGYHIADVVVDGVSKGVVSSYTFLNVTAGHTISATFAVNAATTFTITGSAGTGGSLSISGATVVEAGSNLTVGVTPNTGYEIASVTVDGVAKPLGSVTFSNISANHTVSATFVLTKIAMKLTINANPITRLLGHSAHFFGVIAPNMPDRTPIRLMVRKSGQIRWTNLAPYVRTFGGYHWSFYYHPNTHGTYYFKVYYAGDAQHLGTTSRTITLHWK